jgi:hypothetical protein
MIKKIILTTFVAIFINGCVANNSLMNSSSQQSFVKPEALIDISSERVSFSLKDKKSVEEALDWMYKNRPSKVEISCSNSKICGELHNAIKTAKVPHKHLDKNAEIVVFIYNKVVAKDCDKSANGRYVFGCSVASNMVNMISDYKQIIDPPLSGDASAGRLAKIYNHYSDLHN